MFYEAIETWRPIDEFYCLRDNLGESFVSHQFDVMVYSDAIRTYFTFRCCVWSPLRNDFYAMISRQFVSDTGRPLYWRKSNDIMSHVSTTSGDSRQMLTEG